MPSEWLLSRLLWLIPLWMSLTVHEWAHAWTAWRLGDDTARLQGRMSLNPLVHVDPVGTLLLPLMGVPFGWAKPVPVEPLRFRRRISMGWGMLLTAAAGPVSNVVLAGTAVGLIGVVHAAGDLGTSSVQALLQLLRTLVLFNVVLAVFNLLPIPPLDGSRIVDGLVPTPYRGTWTAFCQLGPLLLVGVIALPFVVGDHPLGNLVVWLQVRLAWFEASMST